MKRFVLLASLLVTALVPVTAAAADQVAPASLRPGTLTCGTPDAPASIKLADPPELPEIAAQQHITGVTTIRVDLDPSGNLEGSSVLTSSGNRWIDAAALTSSRLSAYAAERRACEAVGGSYALIVDFRE